MFDVGFTELMLIGVVSLVVIGPERLPDVARTVGRWVSKMQRFVRGVKSDISAELETGELKKLIGDQKEQISELRTMVNSTRKEIETSTRSVVDSAKKRLDEMEETAQESDDSIKQSPKTGSGIPAQKRLPEGEKSPDVSAESSAEEIDSKRSSDADRPSSASGSGN